MDKPIIPSLPEPVRKPDTAPNPGGGFSARPTPYTERSYGQHQPTVGSGTHSLYSPSAHGFAKNALGQESSEETTEETAEETKKSITRYQFNKSLDKDKKIRQALAKELKIPSSQLYSAKMNQAIEDIKKKLPEAFGSVIDEAELKSLLSPYWQSKHYWEEKHERAEKAGGGFTKKELLEMEQNKGKRTFFERLLGLHKDKK